MYETPTTVKRKNNENDLLKNIQTFRKTFNLVNYPSSNPTYVKHGIWYLHQI